MTAHHTSAPPFRRSRTAFPLLTCALASLGLGVLFGLVWSARNTGSSVTEWQVFLARFASMGAFLALALACKTKTPRPRTMLLVAAVCLLGHGGCGLLAKLLTDTSELVALGAVSVVFEGVGVAVM